MPTDPICLRTMEGFGRGLLHTLLKLGILDNIANNIMLYSGDFAGVRRKILYRETLL